MKLKLSEIRNTKDFSRYFPLAEKEVLNILNNTDDSKKIRIIRIRKYSNKFREVAKVDDSVYKFVLKTLCTYFNGIYRPQECVLGYIKGGGIVKNAKQHLNKKQIIKCDIKNFFYSITKENVKAILDSYGATDEAKEIISNLVTYESILYPGLNTSPVFSNMYCYNMDQSFLNLAKKYNCIYTRYADDITISGNNGVPSKREVENIVNKYNFELSETKFKIMEKGRYQVVTGLTVFDKTMPRIPRNIKKRIRLACFLLSKSSSNDEYSENVKWCNYNYLYDVLKYYKQVEPYFVQKMKIIANGKLSF